MRTPREILFSRHRQMEPKLDDLRRATLAALARGSAPSEQAGARQERSQDLGFLLELTFWRHLVFSLRWHLAALSALWLGILVLSAETPAGRPTPILDRGASDAKRLLLAMRESRRQLQELIETPKAESPLPLAAPASQRRSQRQCEQALV